MTAEYVKELTHSRKTAAGKYECRYCGKAYGHPGPINFHVAQVHPEKLTQKDQATTTKKKDQAITPDAGECSHTWKALAVRNPEHRPAVHQGWTHYCTKCDELGAAQGNNILTEEDMT